MAEIPSPPLEWRRCSGALTIELALDRLDGPGLPPPPVSRETAAGIASRLAADLAAITGGIERAGMVVPGALYDQTELLRPGFPLLQALEDVFRGTLGTGFIPQLIALGTEAGRFPVAALNPQRRPGAGPLLLLPFILVGPEEDIAVLSHALEDRLLQHGEVSADARTAVLQAFPLPARNMSYATVADLCALLQVQLEHSGFGELWRLLEHALLQRPGVDRVTLASGNSFLISGSEFYVPFYTFDDWAQIGPGRDRQASGLAAGYGEWVRGYRQYVMTLTAYGLSVRIQLGDPELDRLDPDTALARMQARPALAGDYLVETIVPPAAENQEAELAITHQADPEAGTLAYTVAGLGQDGEILSVAHYYPLQPQGVQTIIDHLLQRCETGVRRRVSHPGRLTYSAADRRLEPGA